MTVFPRLAVLIACLSLASCWEEEQPAEQSPRPVIALKAVSSFDDDPGFAGTVEARYQTERGFQVLGRIENFDVDVGDLVKKDQHLADLDPTSFRLDVNSKIGDVARAEARLKNASLRQQRTQRLVSSGASTQSQLEADIQARAAAQATLDQANAELVKARTRVDYTTLDSDEDGVVVRKAADIGQTINAGQPVVTIARTDVREVVVDVPEDAASSLRAGDVFEIILQADPDIKAQGKVREIAPQSDAATRTRRVKITLYQPPESFRLGATVTAKPKMSTDRQGHLTIPKSAVIENDGKAKVWIVDPKAQTVRSAEVKVQGSRGNSVQVSDGIAPGEFVVVAGVSDLSDGQKIVFDGAMGQ